MNAIAKGEEPAVIQSLAVYKERGVVQYDRTLSIPLDNRLPALTATPTGHQQVFTVLVIALKKAMDNMNLRLGFNEDQLCELAELIIDESHEDNLALEDVLLFLQQLVRGKTDKLYDRLDIPSFFERFELYREARHKSLMNTRYEQSVNYKAYGPTDRWTENNDLEKQYMHSAMSDYLRTHYEQKPNTETTDCRADQENSPTTTVAAGV